jgi:DNA repair protein RadC
MTDDDSGASYTMIRDLPPTDRPRERLRDFGAGALSNAELLAILLRVGSSKESALAQATRLLKRFDGIHGLARASFEEMCLESGLGPAKVSQIKAALQLGMRATKHEAEARLTVRNAADAAAMFVAEMSLLEQEHVRVMLLDARNHVLATQTVYVGSVHTTQVRISELLSDAVRTKAAAIIALHNHPSGDPQPSAADGVMTRQLYDAAKLMGIDLLDHIVIAGGGWVSLRDAGLGFPKDDRS